MKRRLLLGVAAYLGALAIVCLAVALHFRLDDGFHVDIVSVWKKGVVVRRSVSGDAAILPLEGQEQRVVEKVIGEAPLLVHPDILLAISLVPGRDGVVARMADRVEYFTPDDLVAHQIYDHGQKLDSLAIAVGADVVGLRKLIAARFGIPEEGVLDRVTLRRIRTERRESPSSSLRGKDLTPDLVREAAHAAALHLARGVGADGHFRYQIDVPTDQTMPGYNWPRHGGSTWFLAQATSIWPDPILRQAVRKAASVLTDDVVDCGDYRCVAHTPLANVADSAITLFALVELDKTGVDTSKKQLVSDLARFLRSQQRPDGEFMHRYDRNAKRPVDVQEPYSTGEAALGLARAYSITRDKADLAGASAGLARLVGPNWRFFGNRYYFGEEHWTCQVMAEIWDDAPDRDALDFCLRWSAYNRKLQLRDGETPYDADGAHGLSPYVTPRIPPTASRTEAAIATLEVARRAGVGKDELDALDDQIRRALAVILRQQFTPGPTYLFANPSAVRGAVPGSEVDWQVRIDYTRHPSGAMLRWVDVTEKK